MKNVLLCFGLVAIVLAIVAKSEYFSDVTEEEYDKLQEIARYLRNQIAEADEAEDSTKRLVDQEAEVEQEPEIEPETEILSQSPNYEVNPPFLYKFPKLKSKVEEVTPFAFRPSDPRFFQDFVGSSIETPDTESQFETKEKRPEAPKKVLSTNLNDEVPMVSDNNDPSHSAIRQVPVSSTRDDDGRGDMYFTAIVAGCSAAAIAAVIAVGIGCYRLQKNAKAAADVDYPAYGVTGPNKDVSPTSGDRRLAQSAQMYHYQHQKQQIIAMESMGNKDRRGSISDAESEEENEEGDYTVYECPGLAPTGEMEVKNPLFQDDQTPASGAKEDNNTSEETRELPNLISFD